VGNNNGGMSFFGWLQILFIGLKLTGYIEWSWWWVWSPALFTLGLVVVFFVIGFVAAIIAGVFKLNG